MMSTKAKWPFIAGLIAMLMIDLTIKTHVAYKEKRNEPVELAKEARKYVRGLIFVIIIAGFVHYAFRATREHKKDFSWEKFILGTGKCKKA